MKRITEDIITTSLTLTPAITIPLGLGPLWLDIASVSLAPIWAVFRAAKVKFYIGTAHTADRVEIFVAHRMGFSIPRNIATRYWYNKEATYGSGFWRKQYSTDSGTHKIVVAKVSLNDSELDEKIHEGVVRAKECLDELLNRGTEAKKLKKRVDKLLSS